MPNESKQFLALIEFSAELVVYTSRMSDRQSLSSQIINQPYA